MNDRNMAINQCCNKNAVEGKCPWTVCMMENPKKWNEIYLKR